MLNFSNIGRQIVKIDDADNKKYNNKIVYVDDQYNDEIDEDDDFDKKMKNFYFACMKLKSGKFIPLPNQLTYDSGKYRREICYITASQGSGKSTWTASYIKQYKTLFPKNNVYIISQVGEDHAFKDIKGLLRIPVDVSLITDPLNWETFEDSLVVFDDVDVLPQKLIRDQVMLLRDSIARLGRHKNIYMVQTSHDATCGQSTKSIVRECSVVVLFLKGGNNYSRLLKEYLAFIDTEIRALKKINSRWICIYKDYPNIIVGERFISTKEKFCDEIEEQKTKKKKK